MAPKYDSRKEWEPLIAELEGYREASRAMGGPERIERFMHARGKLDARQRIEFLRVRKNKALRTFEAFARQYPDSPWLNELRAEISQLEMNERVFHLTTQRSRDAARAGHKPGLESSLFKVYATELNKRRFELMVRIAGPQGLGWEGEGFEAEELERTRQWLRSRGNSIEGGTSEIQLNIIAKRVLGLPD